MKLVHILILHVMVVLQHFQLLIQLLFPVAESQRIPGHLLRTSPVVQKSLRWHQTAVVDLMSMDDECTNGADPGHDECATGSAPGTGAVEKKSTKWNIQYHFVWFTFLFSEMARGSACSMLFGRKGTCIVWGDPRQRFHRRIFGFICLVSWRKGMCFCLKCGSLIQQR